MKITSINHNYIQKVQNFADSLPQISHQPINNKGISDDIQKNEWNINILNDVLIKLENNIHSEDNHPLSRSENSPIELYADALSELQKATTSIPIDGNKFQSNLDPAILIDLLVQ